MNTSRQVLVGGIIGLVFLIAFGLFLSDIGLELDLDEVKPIVHDDDYVVEKFVTGLNHPITMTFVGKDILALEKKYRKSN